MKLQYTRPWVYPKQEGAIFHDKRYGIVEASTKSGKTVGCLIWIVEQALQGKGNDNYWWVAPSYRQANIFWRRLKAALPEELYETNETDRWLHLPNGAYVWSLTAERPDLLFGDDVRACVIDEASRVKRDAWVAIRSTLTKTRGYVRIIGNVKGRKNWAYKLARQAEEGALANSHYAKITAWDAVDAGILERQEIEDAKAMLPDHIFRELYLAEPGDDQGNPFGIAAIERCILRDDAGRKVSTPATGTPVVWGWDLAKAQNYSVGVGLDREGRVCRFLRFQAAWEDTFNRVIAETGRVPALVDATPGSGGDPIVERLRAEGRWNFEGYKFSHSSKQQLMLGLAAAIQRQEVRYPDGVIVEELESFEYDVRDGGRVVYQAAEGAHDDCVDALALAVHHKVNRVIETGAAVPMMVGGGGSYWRSIR